jgi:hypothetical protein
MNQRLAAAGKVVVTTESEVNRQNNLAAKAARAAAESKPK